MVAAAGDGSRHAHKRLDAFADHDLQYDRCLKHPWYRRPEMTEQPFNWGHPLLGNSVGAKLRKKARGLCNQQARRGSH
jgi:hypothetical protein